MKLCNFLFVRVVVFKWACMNVGACVWLRVYIYVSTCGLNFKYANLHVCALVSVHALVFVFVHAFIISVCVYQYVYALVLLCLCVNIYTTTYTLTYIYVSVYVVVCASSCVCDLSECVCVCVFVCVCVRERERERERDFFEESGCAVLTVVIMCFANRPPSHKHRTTLKSVKSVCVRVYVCVWVGLYTTWS